MLRAKQTHNEYIKEMNTGIIVKHEKGKIRFFDNVMYLIEDPDDIIPTTRDELVIVERGKTSRLNDGQLHSIREPTILHANGKEEWYQRGIRHRSGAPAIIDGTTETWYEWGKMHRVGGPAHITPFVKQWYRDGQLHRTDGPAVEHYSKDGSLNYAANYINGAYMGTVTLEASKGITCNTLSIPKRLCFDDEDVCIDDEMQEYMREPSTYEA